MSSIGALFLRPGVVRVAQIVTGLLLGWAALAKLGDLVRFAEQVHNFRVVPTAVENLIAMTLPWVELVAALALVLGVRARAGAVVATALLALFTAGVVSAVARGLDFECGCFGTSDATRVGWSKIAQNVAMLAVAALACSRPSREPLVARPTAGSGARALRPEA